jgi:hypothetical protein
VGKQRESKLSQKIMGELRKRGVFCFKVHGSEHMMSGLPDIIACVEGKFVGLETKHPETRNDVSPKQAFVHNAIRLAGGKAKVVCSVEEALRACGLEPQ